MAAYWEPEGYYQLGEGEYSQTSAEDVLSRMCQGTGISTLTELATHLGVRLSWLSDAKRRNILPIRWLQGMSDPVWILTGKTSTPC